MYKSDWMPRYDVLFIGENFVVVDVVVGFLFFYSECT